ncbi:hypothetical protein HO133_000027 [Letharia lupina]|uniref:DUF7924 domain-containing protein n=1 Tax=Letharia lupina TaxID=560253 RepID=A0A8H6FLL3_9LECA|nr:uncharacterized protein HO133_000027 [Letharia lupina]KAF6230768.1 hypothetical protein HO133_000027 [Letharia lupina]
MTTLEEVDICSWASGVATSLDASSDSETQATPTKITHKRKRIDDYYDSSRQHLRRPGPSSHIALAERSPSTMNTPSSPQTRDAQHTQPVTPQTNTTKSSYNLRSRPPTSTSSSSDAKQTVNEATIRTNAAGQGMYFENEAAFQKYPDFAASIENMVSGSRDSIMRDESIKTFKDYRAANTTKNEKTLFGNLVPLIVKPARSVKTAKRTIEDELKFQVKTFESDGLDHLEDQLFVKNILPLLNPADATQQGLTTAKPDYVYGLKYPQFPDLRKPLLSANTEALIGIAPGLRHAFCSADFKGCQHSIEAAENQSQRSGATMVAARRALNRKAKGQLEPAMPKDRAAATKAVATDATAIDDAVTAAHTTINTSALGPQPNEISQEDLGADTSSYAFTISWSTHVAKIHVHWCEVPTKGIVIYHMNVVGCYLMTRDKDLTDFRSHIHNILDWGVGPKRKRELNELESEVAKHESGGG